MADNPNPWRRTCDELPTEGQVVETDWHGWRSLKVWDGHCWRLSNGAETISTVEAWRPLT